MPPLVIAIVLGSTFMHAGWNLLARYERSESLFFHKMLILTAVVGFIPAVWSELHVHSLTPLAWACVSTSACCAAFYLFCLGRAYESSDFTIVYPVARALPVMFIAFIDVSRGRFLTGFGWVGILLVVGGCFLVPLRNLREFSSARYINRTTLWMVLTALGTVGYTFFDKVAAEVVRQGPGTAARYGYFYFTISLVPYSILRWFSQKERPAAPPLKWQLVVPAAILGYSAYWLVLWAYQLSPFASYIVAFRQFSIVIGAVLAFIIYKEQGVAVRLSGALLITSGLVLIGLFGG